MHSRIAIRKAVNDLLEAGPLVRTVFLARTKAISSEKLPCINVITGGEAVEDLSDQWQERRTLQLYVQIYVVHDKDVLDSMDAISEIVEAQVGQDQTLGGACSQIRYRSSQPDYESAAELEAAVLTLTYEVVYIWERQVAAELLEAIQVEFDMASPRNAPALPVGPDGQIDASATIILPQ